MILIGDCVQSMKTLPSASINCCITSPPYWGLRDYDVVGQIGLEQTIEQYIERIIATFREVRRVLRDDGTLWLNLGDCYAGNGGQSPQTGALFKGRARQRENVCLSLRAKGDGLKAKDLVGVPWAVAFALRADGWFLRSDIIWAKPNPMPSSVTDRCTSAHEYIFMLAKNERYYFDADAIAEPVADSTLKRVNQPNLENQVGSSRANGGAKTNGNMKAVIRKQDGTGNNTYTGFNARYEAKPTRNKRSVWTVTTKPFKGAHFATFPPDLIEPCVLAGSPVGGVVLDPFGGAGTTGLVAARHQRDYILCELNPKYAGIAEARIAEDRRKRMESIL